MAAEFFLRYYVGHKGIYGHEFLEFEIRSDGRLRYSNNSNYKSDVLIRKEVFLNSIVVDEVMRIIQESDIMKYLVFINLGRTTRTGLSRTRSVGRNSRSGMPTPTSPSPPVRSAPSSTCRTARTLKDSPSSTIWSRT